MQVYCGGRSNIGLPKEARVFDCYTKETGFDVDQAKSLAEPVILGTGIFLGDNITIYEGTRIEDGCVLEDQSRIGFGCTVGARCRIMYGAYICDRVDIGSDTKIAGFICDAAKIGTGCTVMGQLSHKYTVADLAWGQVDEPSPEIGDFCIVGLGAQIVGGINLGARTFVASGAVLTKSTAPNTVVWGVNQSCHISKWPGGELRQYYERQGVEVADD